MKLMIKSVYDFEYSKVEKSYEYSKGTKMGYRNTFR